MPNHARSRIVITGPADQRASLKALVKGTSQRDEVFFDMNNVIPMPPTLDVTSGSTTDQAMALVAHVDKLQPWQRPFGLGSITLAEMRTYQHNQKFKSDDELAAHLQKEEPGLLALGRQVFQNIKLYGAPTWYEWRCDNWGTKWNAYDQSFEETSRSLKYTIHTAWSCPEPILHALKAKYPGLKFSVKVDGEVHRPYSFTL